MEEKKAIKAGLGTTICVLIILFLVIGIVAMYYFGFIKNNQEILALKDEVNVLNNKNSSQSESINNKIKDTNKDIQSSKNEADNISVADAVNYSDGYYQLFKVKLPKIVGNTKTIDELNAKILNEVLPKTYSDVAAHTEVKSAMDKGSMYDYKYIIKNNILIIYIYSSVPEGGSVIPATGGGLESISYYYDITNDKILSIGEAAKALGLSLNGIEAYDGTEIKAYNELEQFGFVIEIDGNQVKLKSDI